MATIHTFTGNEVIATEVPKYLNDNFSALNTETANLSKSVVKTVNGTSPVNGNVNIVGFDSYWEANEQVSVGEIRVPKGRENSGLFFECVKAGTTGSSQPEVDTAILADFSDVGRIGQVRWIYNIAEKDDDEIFATGVKYSRATYSALWEYVRSKPALLISESEWQAKYQETGGKFVPYYSEGDGSTDFRTPLLCAYATGVADNSKIGTFQEAGLPNITGTIAANYNANQRLSGAFDNPKGYTGANGLGYGSGCEGQLNFDASKSNSIYGKSDTVTPDTMYGVWVIKAFGLIVNAENTDVKGVLSGIETVNNRINTFESYDYIVSSWRSGANWYDVYRSGKIRQGGAYVHKWTGTDYGGITLSFHKAFTQVVSSVMFQQTTGASQLYVSNDHAILRNITLTSFEAGWQSWGATNTTGVTIYWEAEGV